MAKHYIATIDALGMGEEPDRYRATINLNENVQIVAIDDAPFYAMCELLDAMRKLGATGTLEGYWSGKPVFDESNGRGLQIGG